MEMLPEMERKVKNVITRVKATQLQSQVIPMERTYALESNLKYFFVPQENIQQIRYEGTNGRGKRGVDLNIIRR